MLVIDCFEGDWAVIEYGDKTFNIPRDMLPVNIQEGDVISLSVSLNREITKKQKDKIQDLMNDLFE